MPPACTRKPFAAALVLTWSRQLQECGAFLRLIMEFAWQVQAIEADVPAVMEEEADTLPGVVRRHARLSPNAPALIEWKPGRRLTTSFSTLVRSPASRGGRDV